MTISFHEFMTPILLSLKVIFPASLIAFILAFAAARMTVTTTFPFKTVLETVFMLPLVLPPSVVGFILLMLLGRSSWIGQSAEWLLGGPIVFTWGAAVISAAVVAFPLIYQTLKAGFLSIDKDLEDAGRSIGASRWQVLWYITLPLSTRSLLTGYILGFARGLGEFGATLMVAGNIPGKTQTIPTAIYIAVDSGHMSLAWAWTAAIIAISFAMLFIVGRKTNG